MMGRVWGTVRLGDYCSKIGSGSTPRGGEAIYQESGVAFIRSQNVYNGYFATDGLAYLDDEHADQLKGVTVEPGDVLLNITGDSVARSCRVPGEVLPARVSQHVAIIRPTPEEFDSRFVGYFFLTPFMQDTMLSLAGGGGTRKALTKEMIERFEVPRPPRPIQQRIADILSAYDDLIENNRRRIALLENAAGQLYREWFVRLRFPGCEHTRVSDGVPEGWERTSVGGLVEGGVLELQTGPFGTQLHAADYVDEGTPLINVRNIGYGTLRAEKLEFVGERVVERLAQHILRAGDIVFGRKGAVDRHLLVLPAQDGWMQGSDCIRLRFLGDRVTPVFLSLGFREEKHKGWILAQCSNKATMASLNQEVIARVPLLVPNRMLLQEFNNVAGRMLAQVGALQSQAEKAAAARDLLLPRLMSGDLAV